MKRTAGALSIALLLLAACATPARRVALDDGAATSTAQPSAGRLDMPSCAQGDTIGMAIPEYAGNPALDDAAPATTYTTAQQALTAELSQIAPRLPANRFQKTYSGIGRSSAGSTEQQFAFVADGRPGIIVNIEGDRTWRVTRTVSCSAVISQYR